MFYTCGIGLMRVPDRIAYRRCIPRALTTLESVRPSLCRYIHTHGKTTDDERGLGHGVLEHVLFIVFW
jgi:hypothetical protein